MFILIASNNSHKIKEINNFLNPLGIKTFSLRDLDIKADPEEKGKTFQENSLIKAKKIFELSSQKYPVLSDDSGICIDILEGKPGIFSARYGGENLPSQEKNLKLLKEAREALKIKKQQEPLIARFITHLCFYEGENRYISIEESLEGEIKDPPPFLKEETFGYDPIFYPEKYKEKSLSELTIEEKNLISARGVALKKLFIFLKGYTSSQNEKNR